MREAFELLRGQARLLRARSPETQGDREEVSTCGECIYEVLGSQPHFALRHTVAGWTIAELH